MRAMRLHLFQTTHYTCISDNDTLFDPEGGLKQLKQRAEQASVPLRDEEIAVFTTRRLVFDRDTTSIAVGAGPAERSLETGPFFTKSIQEGSYFFYQLQDSSPEGILNALQYGLKALDAKGFTAASDEVILRGVKEAGFYVLQLLIPII